MNFFQAQDHARSSTKLLVVYFLMAIVGLILLTNVLVIALFVLNDDTGLSIETLRNSFNLKLFGYISAGIVAVVVTGSLFKISELSAGGRTVAEMMGGQLIVDGSGDLGKQRVLNVVEEMAIASGTPVPPVYLLDEPGINAFAAGFKPGDGIVAVTRGTVDKLSREQLQGVIAHEFSHILNGDMRLNIRLMGIVHGILVIGLIGYFMMRASGRSRSKNSGGIVMLGLGLMIIGFAGTFFGNLIKAAVSRQREYLADASAVQFTRNPGGIAGALKRIGGNSYGSAMEHPNAAQISHSYFSQGVTSMFNSLFATHPALAKRILSIEPNWNGEFDETVESISDKPNVQAPEEGLSGAARMAVIAATLASVDISGSVGQPSAANLEQAQLLIKSLPADLLKAVHEPHAARAVVYFMVLDEDEAMRTQQLAYLADKADDGVYAELVRIVDHFQTLERHVRLPLINMALSSLHQLSETQYLLFRNNLDALITMDNKIELHEWALQNIVAHHLDPVFGLRRVTRTKYKSFGQIKESCQLLMSVLAYASHQSGTDSSSVFSVAMQELDLQNLELLDKKAIDLDHLKAALEQLNQLHPLKKPALLKACAACITADQRITPVEAELFQAIASMLDCPMPPLLIEQEE